jgi:hypothetical protein
MTAFQFAPPISTPPGRRLQAKRVGDDLVTHHGKRKYYSAREVAAANERCGIDAGLACWSHALFTTHFEFDRLHTGADHACDYLAMKREMLASISTPAPRQSSRPSDESSWQWFDFDLSWLEFPNLDWSIFDFFD